MQFKSIIVALSMAAFATATPVLQARGQSCGNGGSVRCCNTSDKNSGSTFIDVDLTCVDVIQVGGECSQTTACCQTTQIGLIDVNLCTVI